MRTDRSGVNSRVEHESTRPINKLLATASARLSGSPQFLVLMAQTPESKEGKTEDERVTPLDHGIRYRTLGIWRIASLRKDPWWNPQSSSSIIDGRVVSQVVQKIKSVKESIRVLIRLMRDIWDVAPFHLFCWLGFTFAGSMETAIDLYVSTYTLGMVSYSLT